MTGEIATRDDIEQALWRWSEWRADQRGVDEVLELVDRYRLSAGNATQAARDLLDHARREADHIVQSAHAEAAVRPAAGLTQVQAGNIPITAYRDTRGALWVQLDPGPRLMGEDTRTCTACGIRKRMAQFRADKQAGEGRRTQCRDCENEKRRDRRARSNKGR